MRSFFGILILGISASAIAGQGGGNGGFAYTGAISALKFAQNDLSDNFNAMIPNCVNDTLSKNKLKPIDVAKLLQIIRNTRREFTKTVLGTDANGEQQPLMMSYGTDAKGEYIEALQLYFIAYMNESTTAYPKVQTLLLHEASHLFGYNEVEAKKFAKVMRELRENTTGDKPGACWK